MYKIVCHSGIWKPEPFRFNILYGNSIKSKSAKTEEELIEYVQHYFDVFKDKNILEEQIFYECLILKDEKYIGMFDKNTLEYHKFSNPRTNDDAEVINKNIMAFMASEMKVSKDAFLAARLKKLIINPYYKNVMLAKNESSRKVQSFMDGFISVCQKYALQKEENPELVKLLEEFGINIPDGNVYGDMHKEAYVFWDAGFECLYECIKKAYELIGLEKDISLNDLNPSDEDEEDYPEDYDSNTDLDDNIDTVPKMVKAVGSNYNESKNKQVVGQITIWDLFNI